MPNAAPNMTPLPLEVFPALDPAEVGAPPWDPLSSPPPVPLPSSCDIIIVGAGLTGLSAAARCAAAGPAVVVVDRAFGTGATTRSGGVVLGETVEGPDPQFDGCEQTLRTWIDQSGADCDLRWRDCLELARDSRLTAAPIDWWDEGTVRLARRVSGGVLNPAKLLAALYQAAGIAGATIADGVTVTNVTRAGDGIRLATDQGPITARAGIMGVDALCWRREFDPWRERVMTVSLQTAPVSDEGLALLGLKPDEAFYTVDTPLLWGRVMPDRSLLIGRETRPFSAQPDPRTLRDDLAEAGTRLIQRVRGLHSALALIERRRVWTGPLARTAEGHPTLAVDPFVRGLVWAGGYGGQGIAQAFTLGWRAADRILTSEF
jgi:glycine/D-amino acid oxidase-like deaminating enzyme